MHIISKKALKDFWVKHPDAESPLKRWYKIVEESEFEGFNHLRQTFDSADLVGNLTVFNIGSGKYRLIAAIHFNTKKVFVRGVFTHAQYDKGRWKK